VISFMRGIVFAMEPTTPIDMRNRITRTLATILEKFPQRTIIALRHRFRMCIEVNGDTFEQML